MKAALESPTILLLAGLTPGLVVLLVSYIGTHLV